MFKRYLIWAILVTLLFITVIMLSSCNLTQRAEVAPIVTNTGQMVMKFVTSTDWTNSVMLLAFVGSLFAGFNGLKAGWAGAGACLVGMLLKGALTQTWLYLVLGLFLVGGLILAGASVVIRKKALVEVIKGAQNLKRLVTDNDGSQVLAAKQSATTQSIVNDIKNELKLKGIL